MSKMSYANISKHKVPQGILFFCTSAHRKM